MPDESCRICGGILTKLTICAECRKTASMICVNCGMQTKDQYHLDCVYTIQAHYNKNNFTNTFRKHQQNTSLLA